MSARVNPTVNGCGYRWLRAPTLLAGFTSAGANLPERDRTFSKLRCTTWNESFQ